MVVPGARYVNTVSWRVIPACTGNFPPPDRCAGRPRRHPRMYGQLSIGIVGRFYPSAWECAKFTLIWAPQLGPASQCIPASQESRQQTFNHQLLFLSSLDTGNEISAGSGCSICRQLERALYAANCNLPVSVRYASAGWRPSHYHPEMGRRTMSHGVFELLDHPDSSTRRRVSCTGMNGIRG